MSYFLFENITTFISFITKVYFNTVVLYKINVLNMKVVEYKANIEI